MNTKMPCASFRVHDYIGGDANGPLEKVYGLGGPDKTFVELMRKKVIGYEMDEKGKIINGMVLWYRRTSFAESYSSGT